MQRAFSPESTKTIPRVCGPGIEPIIKRMNKAAVIIRFLIIGVLWLAVCVFYVVRLKGQGQELTLLSLFPLIASGIIVFVPLYKKYVKNGRRSK